MGVTHKNQRAVIYDVDIVECPTSDICMARGGYYSGNLGSQTNFYRVEKVNGEWQVELEEMGPAALSGPA